MREGVRTGDFDRAGCDAPVYRGATTRYDGQAIKLSSVFGKDGMGDAGLVSAIVFYVEGKKYDLVDTKNPTYNATLITDVKSTEFFERYLAAVS